MASPQPGDFGLLAGNNTVGRLIRIGEYLNGDGFSKYSHAFVLLDDYTIIEAEPGGARIRPMSEYLATDVKWSSWSLTPDQRRLIVERARETLGVPYSFLDYGAIAAHRFHLPVPWLRAYVASSKHMICSQSVDEIYRRAGVQMFDDNRWPGYVSPAELEQVLAGPKGR
jgi:hypothetical protein